MLWRDLAGRLEELRSWIERYRDGDECVGGTDAILVELFRLCDDVETGRRLSPTLDRPEDSTDPPTDREETIREGIKKADLLNRPGADPGGHPPAEPKAEGKESLWLG